MPYKNDNPEELFQKAAKDYPLKTDNSNWNRVAAGLKAPATEAVAIRNNKFLKYAAIAVLLLGGSILLYKSQFSSVNLAQQEKSKTIPGNQTTLNSTQSSSKVNSKFKVPVMANKPGFRPKNFSAGTGNYTTKLKADNLIVEKAIISDNEKPVNSINNKNIATGESRQHGDQTIIPSTENKVSIDQNNKVSIDQNNKVSIDQNNKDLNNNVEKNYALNSAKDVVTYRQPPVKFYGTLYGSPEFSMVKFQHLVKPGYNIGVALGYKINRRLSTEIGLQREHINYYTDGKYFDKSGLKLKDEQCLKSVNANSKLTIVPVTLSYNFSSHNNAHFYAAIGTDALVITHTESYGYTVSKNGTENNKFKRYGSVTIPKYFTTINASAGYETRVCNWCNMKIEPYYKMPVCNLGVGKLPVTSFGVNIGIVKDLKLRY